MSSPIFQEVEAKYPAANRESAGTNWKKMDEKLPESVDVVVLGTGLVESIVAAACARSGLNVLHLDRNDFYGAEWSSFNLKTIEEWLNSQKNPTQEDVVLEEKYGETLKEGESFKRLGCRKGVKDVRSEWKPASEEMTSVTKKEETVEQTHRSVLDKEWRRFSIDLAPKVLLSRGPMVQTLCDSEVSKYAEFKCVDRFLCMDEGAAGLSYNTVPCSKGDIFQNDNLGMIDKRRLMKFLTFCLQWHSNSEEMEDWKVFSDKPFGEFLNSMDIRDKLQRFITTAIGILHPNANTKEGLAAVCRFVDSVGRFGSSPFLAPLYGCGELPQCFCRLCAVFGGVYCLGRPIEALIEKDGIPVAVIADGQRVNFQHLIMSPEYLPEDLTSSDDVEEWLDRAVYITNKSIRTEDKEHVSLVNLAPLNSASATRLLEVGYEVCAAPKGYFLVHLTGRQGADSDLEKIEERVFEGEGAPSPLWSLRFSSLSRQPAGRLPENVAVAPGPDHSLDYSSVIEASHEIFSKFWPDRDFLPRSLKKEDEDQEAEEVVAPGETEKSESAREAAAAQAITE